MAGAFARVRGDPVTIHINRPSSTRYQARVRLPGHRKYKVIGNPQMELEKALFIMAREFTKDIYKRGDVIVTADYYDPSVVVEMVRK